MTLNEKSIITCGNNGGPSLSASQGVLALKFVDSILAGLASSVWLQMIRERGFGRQPLNLNPLILNRHPLILSRHPLI
jgi:hypothetical protein